MSSHLMKLGLSDTKFELKYHTPKCSRTAREPPSSKSRTLTRPTQPQPTVLAILVDLIGRKQRETCPLPDHDRNPIKFVCLEESCTVRTGCSYCFLEGHSGHAKMETRRCVKELGELQGRAEVSRQLLRAEVLVRKGEVLGKLQAEVGSIRQEFLSNLDYMHRKIREAVEARFAQTIAHLTPERDLPPQDREETRQTDPATSADGDDIISRFMLSSSKPCEPKPPLRTISRYPLQREPLPRAALSREEEQAVLVKLGRLNLSVVEEFLKHEAVQVRESLAAFRIYEEFYTELNSSLAEFFAAFKRALPVTRVPEVGVAEPEVLQPFVGQGA